MSADVMSLKPATPFATSTEQNAATRAPLRPVPPRQSLKVEQGNAQRYLQFGAQLLQAEISDEGSPEEMHAAGKSKTFPDQSWRVRLNGALAVQRACGFRSFQPSRIEREPFSKRRHFATNALFGGFIAEVIENLRDPTRDSLHFRFAHAARGHRGSAHANSAGFHRGQGIEGYRILIHGDSGAVERGLRDAAC